MGLISVCGLVLRVCIDLLRAMFASAICRGCVVTLDALDALDARSRVVGERVIGAREVDA